VISVDQFTSVLMLMVDILSHEGAIFLVPDALQIDWESILTGIGDEYEAV